MENGNTIKPSAACLRSMRLVLTLLSLVVLGGVKVAVAAVQAAPTFQQVPGSLVQGQLNVNGVCWGVNAQKNIYVGNISSGTSTTWTQTEWQSTCVSVNDSNQALMVGLDGNLYMRPGTSPTNLQGTAWAGGKIPNPNGLNFKYASINNAGIIVAMDSNNNIWTVYAAAALANPSVSLFQQVQGALVQGQLNSNSICWGVNSSNNIYVGNITTGTWTQADEKAVCVSVNDSNQAVMVDTEGNLYMRPGTSSTNFQGTAWAAGEISNPHSLDFKYASINNAGVILALDSNNNIWTINMPNETAQTGVAATSSTASAPFLNVTYGDPNNASSSINVTAWMNQLYLQGNNSISIPAGSSMNNVFAQFPGFSDPAVGIQKVLMGTVQVPGGVAQQFSVGEYAGFAWSSSAATTGTTATTATTATTPMTKAAKKAARKAAQQAAAAGIASPTATGTSVTPVSATTGTAASKKAARKAARQVAAAGTGSSVGATVMTGTTATGTAASKKAARKAARQAAAAGVTN